MSKRFEENPGIRIKKKKRFAVVIDTSGSIQEAQLPFSPRSQQSIVGNRSKVIECDADIGRHYDFEGRFDTQITGGGGTILTLLSIGSMIAATAVLMATFYRWVCRQPVVALAGAFTLGADPRAQ